LSGNGNLLIRELDFFMATPPKIAWPDLASGFF
jgi:hypothetical protein